MTAPTESIIDTFLARMQSLVDEAQTHGIALEISNPNVEPRMGAKAPLVYAYAMSDAHRTFIATRGEWKDVEQTS